MIDTINVLLSEQQFKITKPEKFYPNAEKLLSPSYFMGGSYAQARQNPIKQNLKLGLYLPRLTLTKRSKGINRCEITLKVEYSIPKLLFGNNFDELIQSDIPKSTKKLVSALKYMGVQTSVDEIQKARIGAIHYSKNIALTDHTSSSMYLHELSKVNMNMKLDVNQTDFRNGGRSLKYRTNKREIVFYDKIKDLQQARFSEKRSEETDNKIQLNLFSEKQIKKPFEVLRIEIRLGDMHNIRKSLSNAGIEANIIFEDLCQMSVSKAVIQSYWSQIRESYIPMLSSQNMKPEAYLITLLSNNKQISKMRLLSFVGIRALTERMGLRDLRSLLEGFGYKGWRKLISDLKKVNIPHNDGLLNTINKAITSFIPLKLVDFEE